MTGWKTGEPPNGTDQVLVYDGQGEFFVATCVGHELWIGNGLRNWPSGWYWMTLPVPPKDDTTNGEKK
jgi:hypothetical protein